jgi:hypothetical protein
MDELKQYLRQLIEHGMKKGLVRIHPIQEILQPFLYHPNLSTMSKHILPQLCTELDEIILEDDLTTFCKQLFKHHHLKQRIQYVHKQEILSHTEFQQSLSHLFQPFFHWFQPGEHIHDKTLYEDWKRECIVRLDHYLLYELFPPPTI